MLIKGIQKDYTILMKNDFDKEKFFPKLEFFWSFDCLNFAKLPVVSPNSENKLRKITDLFVGQHDKNLFEINESDDEGNSHSPIYINNMIRIYWS